MFIYVLKMNGSLMGLERGWVNYEGFFVSFWGELSFKHLAHHNSIAYTQPTLIVYKI